MLQFSHEVDAFLFDNFIAFLKSHDAVYSLEVFSIMERYALCIRLACL